MNKSSLVIVAAIFASLGGSSTVYAGGPKAASKTTCAPVVKPQGCDLDALKKDTLVTSKLTIELDPAGLVLSPKSPETDPAAVFQDYAQRKQCSLYTLSVRALTKSLLSGLKDMNGIEGDNMPKEASENKFFLLPEKEAGCIKLLNFQLPIVEIKPLKKK